MRELTDRRRQTQREFSFDVRLRSQHVAYLRTVAEREETNLSRAFVLILERYANGHGAPSGRPVRKERVHLWLSPHHRRVFMSIAARMGVQNGEVARRLIDEAIAAERRP